jgi:hypothetical protein
MRALACLAAVVVCLGSPGVAAAQQAQPARFDISGGVRYTFELPFDGVDAEETSASGGRYRLFSSSTTLEPSMSFEGRVGFQLTTMLQVGVTGSYGGPRMATRLTSDVENIPDLTVGEEMTRWTVGGDLLAELTGWRIGARAVPFLVAGVGYVRELHEGRTLSDDGQFYDFGGGVSIVLRDSPRVSLKRMGVRVDARAHARSGGAAFGDRVRVAPAISAVFFAGF